MIENMQQVNACTILYLLIVPTQGKEVDTMRPGG